MTIKIEYMTTLQRFVQEHGSKYGILARINIIFLVLSIFCMKTSYAQMQISEVDAEKVGYKKMVKYLKKIDLTYFSDIQPSLNDSIDMETFYFHNAEYTVNAPLEHVWNTCILSSPANLWNGKTLGLSCVYNKNSNKIFYRDDDQFDKLELNQVYFLNLNFLRLFNLPVALITTNIDHNEKSIEFTYIKGNKSAGKQTVSLISNKDGVTQIVHDTFFKSNSKFRDKRLYSRFHEIAIHDLHKKIDMYSTTLPTPF